MARGQVVATFDQAREAFDQMPRPVVTKPVTGSGGRGVSVDIRTVADLEAACAGIVERGRSIVIEEMFNGIDLRIMTIAGRAVATSLRVPANVIGDGRRTVVQLVNAKNAVRTRNPYTQHSPIVLDDTAGSRLSAEGMTAESVPLAGQRVFLHLVANVSSGGDCYEVDDLVHPDLLRLAEHAAACFPTATHAGMDILAERLDAGLDAQRAIISEVNLNNEIPMHIMPTYGPSTNVHEVLIEAVPPAVDLSPDSAAVVAKPGAVEMAHPDALMASAQPVHHPISGDSGGSSDSATSGREVDTHHLRTQFAVAGYDAVGFHGALIFLTRSSEHTVVHRSGRSVVSREVARHPEALHALAATLGLPVLNRTNLQQRAAPSGISCHLLLIEGEIAATLLAPSRRSNPDVEVLHEVDEHISAGVARATGLANCPFPELAQYVAALRAPLGPTPILSVSFGLRTEPGSGRRTWALRAIDPDPILARFANPRAGVAAEIYPAVVATLLNGGSYVLPQEQVFLPAQD